MSAKKTIREAHIQEGAPNSVPGILQPFHYEEPANSGNATSEFASGFGSGDGRRRTG